MLQGKAFGGQFKQIKTVIQRNGKFFLVSTNDTFDCGLETMIFASEPTGKVTDWQELYCDLHTTIESAITGHRLACETFQPKEGGSYDDEY